MKTIVEELQRVKLPPFDEPKFIEVMVRSNKEDEPEKCVLHEDEVKLLKTLERLQKTANIYPDSMNEIWSQIRAYARSEYLKGNYSGMQIAKDEQNT